ncbi:MAG: ATP-dependent DNA helicase RecG [Magnetococcales bacterium]|nr:ATP-dependent DNA helicase RecG [Magnetococcales bacterium]
MTPAELFERLALGEDSRHQFKADVKNDTSLAAEMADEGMVHADVVPVDGTTLADFDTKSFQAYFQKRYEKELMQSELPLSQLLNNLNLAQNGTLNLAGLLLFGQDPQRWRPQFMIKGMTYPGTEIDLDTYMDCQDIFGAFPDLFRQAVAFVLRNLRHIQDGQGINSKGRPEIPRLVLEEMLVNALVHRDYFIAAPIRVFIYSDRVEIISPGHLPNHLRIEHIQHGITNQSNPVLASHASHLLPYQGIGTGITRALRAYPAITFTDDRDGNQFKVCMQRRNTNPA